MLNPRKDQDGGLAIGSLARDTGANIETIRYYERIGILPRPRRSAGGRRIYDPADANRLSFVLRSRALGLSLDDISKLLALHDGDRMACAQARSIAERQLVAVREKLGDLHRLAAALESIVGRCDESGGAGRCPLIEALSAGAPPASASDPGVGERGRP